MLETTGIFDVDFAFAGRHDGKKQERKNEKGWGIGGGAGTYKSWNWKTEKRNPTAKVNGVIRYRLNDANRSWKESYGRPRCLMSWKTKDDLDRGNRS